MKALANSALRSIASAAVLGLVPAALAHGDDMNMGKGEADKPLPADQYPPTYFAHPGHRAVIYGHVALMVFAWVFLLPTGKTANTRGPTEGALADVKPAYSRYALAGPLPLYAGGTVLFHGGERCGRPNRNHLQRQHA